MIWAAMLAQVVSVVLPQSLIPVEIPEAGQPSEEKRARPERTFFTQPRIPAGEAEILLDPKALDEFRNRFNLNDHAPFALYEWVDRVPPASRHREFVFCSVYGKLGVGWCAACFQDTDRDGALDAVARFEGGIPITGLAFEPLTPVAYRYVDGSGERQPHSMYAQDHLGLSFIVDGQTGRLRFRPEINGFGLEPVAEVDPGALPQSVTVAGAVVRVSA